VTAFEKMAGSDTRRVVSAVVAFKPNLAPSLPQGQGQGGVSALKDPTPSLSPSRSPRKAASASGAGAVSPVHLSS
jgi:hypothetical protein